MIPRESTTIVQNHQHRNLLVSGIAGCATTALAELENHVINAAGARKIPSGVVDYRISTKRLHQAQVGGAVYCSDVLAKGLAN
jgi:hypothetical protein